MKPRLYTFGNVSLSIKQWAERIGMSHWTLRSRLRRGWDLADALLTPVGIRINRSTSTVEALFQAMAA